MYWRISLLYKISLFQSDSKWWRPQGHVSSQNFRNCFVFAGSACRHQDETIPEILPFHTRGGPFFENSEASSFAKKVPSMEGYLLHPSQLRWEGLRPLRDGGGVGLYHPTEVILGQGSPITQRDWTSGKFSSGPLLDAASLQPIIDK